ncbi:MAG TPA: M2 family metallopeptidase [Steroidobacteraceae bacterium]|nr:M2 family metallopeptidase [Steroidobacteraceae bacterium]
MRNSTRAAVLVAAGLSAALAVFAQDASQETADQFVARLNKEFTALSLEASKAGWTQATYINDDTEWLNAKANERYLEYFSKAVEESKRYLGQTLSKDTARALDILRQGVSTPAPNDAAKRAELSKLGARLEADYGAAEYCRNEEEKKAGKCRNIDDLSKTLAESRDYDAELEAWAGWHSTARGSRANYQRMVVLANEGARELGYKDLGAQWRSGYDMSADAFAAETERLYAQVQPLYKQLHCYTRAKLQKKYGADRVPTGKPIPAHLLGNMWAQQWNKIYDLLEPYPGVTNLDVDKSLKEQGYDATKMMKSAENFYRSIGFPQLPETFWERSMLVRPRDRNVVCHASAWDIDSDARDVRIKMCATPTEEDLTTMYHELGHVYYYLWYRDLPYMFQGGAHDGFHEAIGDTINLSMTPGYLHTINLVGDVKPSKEFVINQQMKMALDKIAFLPFGKLIDEWRWKVFSGEIKPENYNASWWELRRQYQGIAPANGRTEQDFDPGAKYHIPANVPYTRYFLSFIVQFQFQKALCQAAGYKGPLSECSIYGNKEAGTRFAAMLSKGQSQPWQDTLFELTGTRQMDASAIIEYFQPLIGWLKTQNKGQQCGW